MIVVDGHKMKVTAIKDPAELPHKALGVDVALECTGIFTSREKAAAHLKAGAKRVLISAPAEGADLTVVYGVNRRQADQGCTSSSPTRRARPTAWRRSPRCSMTPSASSTAS